jgi:catechol 2,3-dioxygenase-like lactoylglutathione lyase family enzyme
MRVRSLDHVNISTSRLEATCAFFEEVLGLTRGPRPDFGFPGAWLYAGDKDVVHLVERREGRAASSEAALDHFALSIDDHEAWVERLEAKNIPHRVVGVPGRKTMQIFLTDPNGVVVELNWKG